MADRIEIRRLVAADAEKLTTCFRRCYGDTYVAGFFHDPVAIRARLDAGAIHSVVAVTEAGEIVGHMAMTRRHADALTVELGNTIVDPHYRGQSLAPRLGAALFEACREGGYVGFHHYPTTAHAIMQKLAVDAGGIETGVMLGYIPADTDYKALSRESATGRLAVVAVYQPLAPAPAREVFVPARFEQLLLGIYLRAGLTRTVRPATTGHRRATDLGAAFDAARSLLRIEVACAGADVAERVAAVANEDRADVTHVDLLLSDPGAPEAFEALRKKGFFFCALLPEFSTADVLRLQRLSANAERAAPPELVYADARAILHAALADREAARRGSAS